MKTIILVRHAKASRDIAGLEDFDRPLTAEGYAEAYKMAAAIKNKKVKPEFIVSSPAIRAASTAYIFARELKIPFDRIAMREALFAADYKDVLKVVRNVFEEFSSLMVFGHNPSFEDVANYLSETPVEKIHTCGVLSLQKEKPESLSEHSMKLNFYLHPKSV
jgi:phosphohistidine phosphatase